MPDAEQPIDQGTPGASAEREYERRVDARKQRIRECFGNRLGGWALALTDDPQSTRAWARGAQGEREVAQVLTDLGEVRVLHDRRVWGTSGNIDHIAIAPAGIFVIDAKRYDGTIRIRDVGGLFRRDERLYVGRRDCSKLAAGLTWQVEAVQAVLRSLHLDPVPPVTPVLCFVRGEWPLFRPPNAYRGVRLEGTRSIRKLLVGRPFLGEPQIDVLTRRLAEALPAK